MTESLAEALALVQSKLPEIGKSRTAVVQTKDGGSYAYAYADLAEVTKHILPLLGDAGLSWITKPMLDDEGKLVLEYKLLHTSGQCEEGRYPLPQSGSPQQIGSAITYARRYCLCSMTGVAPEQDDDDGAAAAAGDRPRTAQRRARGPAQREQAGSPQPPRRTAQRAAGAQPPLPGEDGYQDQQPDRLSDQQLTKLHTVFSAIDWGGRDDKLRATQVIVGREIASTKELTSGEAHKLIDALEKCANHNDPQAALTGVLETISAAQDKPDNAAEPATLS